MHLTMLYMQTPIALLRVVEVYHLKAFVAQPQLFHKQAALPKCFAHGYQLLIRESKNIGNV